MKAEGNNLLVLTMSAFWSSFRWLLATLASEGREVSIKVVVIDRFHTFPKLWDLIMDSYSALRVGVDSGHCYVRIHYGKQNKD